MAVDPPQTAAAAIFAFFGDLIAAARLRRPLYERVARDPQAWRRGAVVVILAALASDSLGLYTDVDVVLVHLLSNWSLLAIMLLALLRWAIGSAAAFATARVLQSEIDYRSLLRTTGYAYAPQCVHMLPALLYWFGLASVTLDMVVAIRWVVLPWTIAALTVAVRSTGITSTPRAIAVAISLFIAANLFDVALDLALEQVIGPVAPIRTPADGLA